MAANRRDFIRLTAATLAATAGVGAVAGTAGASAGGESGAANWAALRKHLTGDLVLPSDTGYDQAHQLSMGQFDVVRPRAVAYCESERDVQTVLAFARDHALHTVPRSGGHSFGGYSTSPGVVLDVSRLNQVRVRPSTVVLGPGVQQVDALEALSPLGLSLVGGLCPNVCAGGFLQGGGIGLGTRKFGMASDRLVSASVVLADGRTVRASETEHPDLFWALRGGGGGNFGVVTSYEVTPTRIPSIVNYNVGFPWDSAREVIRAWQHWIVDGSRDNGAALGIQYGDAGTGVPDVLAHGGWFGSKEELDKQLDAFVADVGLAPISRSVEEKPYGDGMMEWYGCADLTVKECHRVGYTPEAKLPRQNFSADRNRMYSEAIPDDGLDRMLAAFVANRRSGQFRFLSFFALGGVANEVDRSATAYVHRTTQFFAGFSLGLLDPAYTEEDRTTAVTWIDAAFDTLGAYSLHESYQNFIDPALVDWQKSYYDENYRRLAEVKRSYDPDRFFRFAQGIR
ncbi:FAD-binding oxidoreductase [Streptomyces sp. 150FB]|uniref:FAD-binding oxidoreductase n=1 Tax=Streptomyces sp. 150FB TaxID=1576605 RepID=UPI00069682A3|nr:FAD-binding oxidoreductase [Streptomyces sp. 150FB]